MMAASDTLELRNGRHGDLATFTPAAIDRIARMLPVQSKATVMEVLGISSNTWLKIKRGEPVRRSIGKRLIARVERMRFPPTGDGDARAGSPKGETGR